MSQPHDHDDVAPYNDPLAPPSEFVPTTDAGPRPEPATVGDAEASEFASLGLIPELLTTLRELGYQHPTPIQAETIPLLLAGRDILGQAATGTGKTASFALPILQQIGAGTPPRPRALVLTPTRELAMQVSEAMRQYGAQLGVRVVAVFGGQPIHQQLRALDRGVHVVVATPGRALDHIRRRSLRLDQIEAVVLDEADEMLDMGFSEDLEAILEETPSDRQTVLFSATLPARINAIADRHQRDPVRVRIGRTDATPGNADVTQSVYLVNRKHKAAALGRVLDMEAPGAALVFCRTRADVDDLTEVMMGRGYRAESLHGGMDQHQRDRVMGRLRDGTAELIIATDVAARGLDVDRLTHVVNYDVPTAPEAYVHRIGRVGRAGREGVAITLVEPREKRLIQSIERLTKQSIPVRDLPTVADVRDSKLRQTSKRIAEALADTTGGSEEDELESYRSVFEALSADHDAESIAMTAIRLLHRSEHPGQDVEIPAVVDRSRDRDRREGAPQRRNRDRARRPSSPGDTGFVYIGVGGRARIRPGDLVGAIANNTSLTGKQIGPIRIADHHSVVGVPADAVDEVIATMHGMHLRGKRAKARRYTD